MPLPEKSSAWMRINTYFRLDLVPCVTLLLISATAYGQDTINRYTYMHLVKNDIPSKDSIKVKTGYWIEMDSAVLQNFIFRLDDGGQSKKTQVLKVHRGEGFYADNNKVGKWKYYDANGLLLREIDYSINGIKEVIKFYYPNGSLHVLGKLRGLGKIAIEVYGMNGEVSSKCELPTFIFSDYTVYAIY